METNHLRHPGGEPLPDLLQHGGLWGGRHETLRISFDDKQPAPTQRPRPLRLYLDDLRLGRRADEERGGGVGSEDVGPRRLVAPRVVAVAGVVPATRGKTIKPDQRKGVCAHVTFQEEEEDDDEGERLARRSSESALWSVWSPGC